MAHYLVVAHGIADRELTSCLERLAADDAAAACTLLITATHPLRLMIGQTPELESLARQRGVSARTQLQGAGVFLAGMIVGDGSPTVAVEDELRSHPETYDAILLCTARPGLRAWLGGDLRTRIEERAALPAFHVFAGTADPWRRGPAPRIPRLATWWERTRFAPSTAEAAASPVPTRRQMVPLLCLMLAYLVGGLGLAIAINRGFVLNDAVALCVYTVVIGGLLAVMRMES